MGTDWGKRRRIRGVGKEGNPFCRMKGRGAHFGRQNESLYVLQTTLPSTEGEHGDAKKVL